MTLQNSNAANADQENLKGMPLFFFRNRMFVSYLFHNDMLICFVVIIEAVFSNLSEKAHIKRVSHWLIG